jgi:hypothetical protein
MAFDRSPEGCKQPLARAPAPTRHVQRLAREQIVLEGLQELRAEFRADDEKVHFVLQTERAMVNVGGPHERPASIYALELRLRERRSGRQGRQRPSNTATIRVRPLSTIMSVSIPAWLTPQRRLISSTSNNPMTAATPPTCKEFSRQDARTLQRFVFGIAQAGFDPSQ